jgi:dolichol-phosphate mannosyltransferase
VNEVELSIVLPAYNESASIQDAVAQCARLMQMVEGTTEVIVVDDGSEDGTDLLLKGLSADRPWLRVVRHHTNLGYGQALRTGFAAAKGKLVFYSDADNQFDITELAEHMPLMSDADMLVGFRVYRYDPFPRLFLSWVYNRLVRLLFRVKVKDVDCSFKAMRRSRLDALVLLSNDFFIDTELVARARKWNWRIIEVGVRHYPRRVGKTSVRPSDIPKTLRVIGAMWREIHFPNRAKHTDAFTKQAIERQLLRGQ